jgi:hypothetical protein
MSHAAAEPSLSAHVRVMQIIKFSLIMGVTVFAAFVLFLDQGQKQNNEIVVWIQFGLGVAVIVARLFVPAAIVRSGLRRIAAGTWAVATNPNVPVRATDEGRLAALYQTQLIIGSALLDGGAFANLVACMMTGHLVSWIMTGILWLGLVIDFPTRLGVERWIEDKLAWIRDERNLSRPPA